MKQKKLFKQRDSTNHQIGGMSSAQKPPVRDRWFLTNTKFLLFIIVLFGIILRLIFFSGVSISDDLAYSNYAYNLDQGLDYDHLSLSTRLGIIYTTALSYSIFGVNDFSSVLFTLLTSIGSIILIFYFGKLLFNEKIGLMAAFLLSFFPLDLVYSTKLSNDIPAAFFMSLGVYIFLYSEKTMKTSSFQSPNRLNISKNKIGYLFAGIFIGIGYFIKETMLLIGLFFLAYLLYKKRVKKEYFMVVLGFLIIFIIECSIFYTLAGNPLFRHIGSQQSLSEAFTGHNYYGRLEFPEGLFHYPYIILTGNLSLFYIFIFIALAYCLMHRKREIYILGLWFIPLLLYLSFGTTSPVAYVPFRAVDRYLAIITIPGLLLLAFFLSVDKEAVRKVIMPSAMIFLLLTSVGFVYLREDRNRLSTLREFYPYLQELNKYIYTDERSIRAISYISGYKNEVALKEYPDALSNIKDAYIVINKHTIRSLKEAYPHLELFPKEINNPPESWVRIKEFGKEEKNKIIVYYAS